MAGAARGVFSANILIGQIVGDRHRVGAVSLAGALVFLKYLCRTNDLTVGVIDLVARRHAVEVHLCCDFGPDLAGAD